jgi:hypothetical protein
MNSEHCIQIWLFDHLCHFVTTDKIRKPTKRPVTQAVLYGRKISMYRTPSETHIVPTKSRRKVLHKSHVVDRFSFGTENPDEPFESPLWRSFKLFFPKIMLSFLRSRSTSTDFR